MGGSDICLHYILRNLDCESWKCLWENCSLTYKEIEAQILELLAKSVLSARSRAGALGASIWVLSPSPYFALFLQCLWQLLRVTRPSHSPQRCPSYQFSLGHFSGTDDSNIPCVVCPWESECHLLWEQQPLGLWVHVHACAEGWGGGQACLYTHDAWCQLPFFFKDQDPSLDFLFYIF